MKGDLTAESKTGHDQGTARAGSSASAWRSWRLWPLLGAALAALLGAALAAIVAQVPARHSVDVGGYDAAYVQGFFDPERADQPGDRPYLAGSDGSARWTGAAAALLFPQASLPGELVIRMRGRDAATTAVRVLLGGGDELGRFSVGPGWQEHSFTIAGGWLKPSDVLIELQTETAPLSPSDRRAVGVLVDRAEYRAASFPATPYPAQLAYGALSAALLFLLTRGDRPAGAWRFAAGLALLSLAQLLLYHLQPAYPYPLRQLPQALTAALGALVALRYAPAAAAHAAWAPDALALAGVGAWLAAALVAAQGHLVLSAPGVEKDFRVFATRAFEPAEVFRADGFYNLGYPLLLWLATPLAHGNPFLAARAIAALSGAAMLLAGWWLARRVAGRGAALLALLALGLSASVVQYGLYVGSDMPFAALCTLALALLVSADKRATTDDRTQTLPSAAKPTAERGHVSHSGAHVGGRWPLVALAGLVAGAAFLVRHPGLLLLPLGWLALLAPRRAAPGSPRRALDLRPAAVYSLAFALAIIPQVAVNLRDTGQPLYSQQAKNVWLAVYGDGDWGRWAETSDDVTLLRVALQDPGRLLGAWWANLSAFIGTGAEDTGEFGRAIQLRLLGFPANWLALTGLLHAGVTLAGARLRGAAGSPQPEARGQALLLAWVALYVAAVSVGLALPRFFLPLAPVYAVGAAWAALLLANKLAPWLGQPRALLALGLVLLMLLWGGLGAGTSYVLRPQPDQATPGQPPETLAAAQLIQRTLQPGERLVARLGPGDEDGLALTKYSAVAHQFVAASDGAAAAYLLWSSDLGPPPSGAAAGSAGRYALIRRAP